MKKKTQTQSEQCFLVGVFDVDNTSIGVLCKNKKELSNLLRGIDEKQYTIVNVQNLGSNVYYDYKELLKKDKDLETGEGGIK